MKATNIEWDVERPDDLKYLPSEVILPVDIADFYEAVEISDWLSDEYGFGVKSFSIDL